MLESLLTAVAGAVVATISAVGYLGVVLLMAIESACVPLPSEVIMPFAGYLASTGRLSLPLAATPGAPGQPPLRPPLAAPAGALVQHRLGPGLRGRAPRRLVERWGSYVLLGRRDLDLADRFF